LQKKEGTVCEEEEEESGRVEERGRGEGKRRAEG
jgi:hypothetical protein